MWDYEKEKNNWLQLLFAKKQDEMLLLEYKIKSFKRGCTEVNFTF